MQPPLASSDGGLYSHPSGSRPLGPRVPHSASERHLRVFRASHQSYSRLADSLRVAL